MGWIGLLIAISFILYFLFLLFTCMMLLFNNLGTVHGSCYEMLVMLKQKFVQLFLFVHAIGNITWTADGTIADKKRDFEMNNRM